MILDAEDVIVAAVKDVPMYLAKLEYQQEAAADSDDSVEAMVRRQARVKKRHAAVEHTFDESDDSPSDGSESDSDDGLAPGKGKKGKFVEGKITTRDPPKSNSVKQKTKVRTKKSLKGKEQVVVSSSEDEPEIESKKVSLKGKGKAGPKAQGKGRKKNLAANNNSNIVELQPKASSSKIPMESTKAGPSGAQGKKRGADDDKAGGKSKKARKE